MLSSRPLLSPRSPSPHNSHLTTHTSHLAPHTSPDDEVKNLYAVAASPDLYPQFVEFGAVRSLLVGLGATGRTRYRSRRHHHTDHHTHYHTHHNIHHAPHHHTTSPPHHLTHLVFQGLLSHENTDISISVLALLQELMDPETAVEAEEEMGAFVDALVKEQGLELLVQVPKNRAFHSEFWLH